ncbi:MAG TPA: TlyA family RNA methyltransferase [Miltoncostaeaceae bacterium]|jgi:23S rRNA (cytidine1920-2'-O)/16S rRNA (cytidine1409-2'-O)-methyltransferase|nr:TlyA family RNA methyltransferase [Miltoncostaeaceae bacterium]
MPRSRLDVALVERGLFPSRARAQAAVMAGRVHVDGRRVDKPGAGVAEGAAIAVEPAREYVSRGGIKLANALDALEVDVRGACAIDLGASTGGFTDCLLQRGARRVIAVDVGYGQLDWALRQDERVHVMERTNARDLRPELLPWQPDLATCDLSFISIGTVWGAVRRCLAPGWRAMVMVKPQFEVGRERVGSGGVVRDPQAREDAVRAVIEAIEAEGGRAAGTADSGLPGPRGNREIFVLAVDAAGAG